MKEIYSQRLWAKKTNAQEKEKKEREKRTRKRFLQLMPDPKLNKVIKAPSTWSSPKATTTQNTPPTLNSTLLTQFE